MCLTSCLVRVSPTALPSSSQSENRLFFSFFALAKTHRQTSRLTRLCVIICSLCTLVSHFFPLVFRRSLLTVTQFTSVAYSVFSSLSLSHSRSPLFSCVFVSSFLYFPLRLLFKFIVCKPTSTSWARATVNVCRLCVHMYVVLAPLIESFLK